MSNRSRDILLIISFALNVFVLGAAVGGAYMWRWTEVVRPVKNRQALRFAAEQLPPDQRKAFQQEIAAARRASAPDIETARGGRATLAGLLSDKELDRNAIDTELAKIRTADVALRARLEQAIIDYAQRLPLEQRLKLVEGLRTRNMLRNTPAKK